MDIQSLFGLPKGTVVLVTGGGRGLGKMIAKGFVQNGATVYISSRNASVVEATSQELSSLGPGKCIGIPADLSKHDECIRLKDAIEQQSGILHILVNNSGISHAAPLESYEDSKWTELMEVNVQRVFTLIQSLTPLLEKGHNTHGIGRIINIGTVYAINVPPAESYAYTASKAALHHLSRHLASQLGSRGITVNVLAPGPFNTDLLSKVLDASTEEIGNALPMRRIGEPEDIAAACLWLSGRGGAWVTGAIIPIDGGNLLAP